MGKGIAPGQEKQDLERIPWVGPSIAQDLLDLGIRSVDDLVDEDPEELFERLCALRHERIDRCVLYVFRSSVYWAGAELPDPELSKWWNWKDGGPARRIADGSA